MSEQETNERDSSELPSVSVLVLNWNGRSLLPACLPPLLAQRYPHYQVILVDNASSDDSAAYVAAHFPQVHIIRLPQNLGFARGYNAALKQCRSEIAVLLNNDVIVQENWLAEMIRPFTQDPTIGIVGGKLLFPDGTIQHLGARLSYPLALSEHTAYRQPDNAPSNAVTDAVTDTDYVTGAALAIPRAILAAVDYFDEAFSPFYYEEVDLCYRVRAAGYRVVVNPRAAGIHDESASLRQVRGVKAHAYHQNRLRFILKHYSAEQVLHDFMPAEQQRLAQPATAHEYHVLRRVYLETAVSPPDSPHKTAIRRALLTLYKTAVAQQPAAYAPPSGADAAAWPHAALAQHTLAEPDFHSAKPLLGPLIVAARRLWHSIAGKWALRQLIQQQNRFNALTARLLDEQHDRSKHTALEIELLFRELLRREEETAALQQTVAGLQQRLATLEAATSPHTPGENQP